MLDARAHERFLRSIITLSESFDDAVLAVTGLGWDGRDNVATMTSDDARGVLERCIAGRVSLDRLTNWAEVIEGRDDIELDAKSPADLATLLFELSNPEINNLSLDTIRVWATRLRQSG